LHQQPNPAQHGNPYSDFPNQFVGNQPHVPSSQYQASPYPVSSPFDNDTEDDDFFSGPPKANIPGQQNGAFMPPQPYTQFYNPQTPQPYPYQQPQYVNPQVAYQNNHQMAQQPNPNVLTPQQENELAQLAEELKELKEQLAASEKNVTELNEKASKAEELQKKQEEEAAAALSKINSLNDTKKQLEEKKKKFSNDLSRIQTLIHQKRRRKLSKMKATHWRN
jgi:hypothetical protein